MDLPRSRVAVVAAIRFYGGQLKRIRWHRSSITMHVSLGPVNTGGRFVTLRGPRMSDANAWREIRLRDQHRIEPFWMTAALSWPDRHTEIRWVRECLQTCRLARAGCALPLVVEVDGRFAGQCNLEWINPYTRTAEVGIWIDSRVAGQGVGTAALAMLTDYSFGTVRLHRLTAPICAENASAARMVEHVGLKREGTMTRYLDVEGRRKDYDLWAITAEDWCPRRRMPITTENRSPT